ncbi:hypothetical protein D515_03056 [Grimontia indica]|uniref:Uncharacterized protein n=1 Tax=Grimontia indica TaxID=1056512 RepID=R1GQB2_9GAMM|nr:hypothetical protein D515_03056 [Grimontia indica]
MHCVSLKAFLERGGSLVPKQRRHIIVNLGIEQHKNAVDGYLAYVLSA